MGKKYYQEFHFAKSRKHVFLSFSGETPKIIEIEEKCTHGKGN